jgi:hypothetical protein
MRVGIATLARRLGVPATEAAVNAALANHEQAQLDAYKAQFFSDLGALDDDDATVAPELLPNGGRVTPGW